MTSAMETALRAEKLILEGNSDMLTELEIKCLDHCYVQIIDNRLDIDGIDENTPPEKLKEWSKQYKLYETIIKSLLKLEYFKRTEGWHQKKVKKSAEQLKNVVNRQVDNSTYRHKDKTANRLVDK